MNDNRTILNEFITRFKAGLAELDAIEAAPQKPGRDFLPVITDTRGVDRVYGTFDQYSNATKGNVLVTGWIGLEAIPYNLDGAYRTNEVSATRFAKSFNVENGRAVSITTYWAGRRKSLVDGLAYFYEALSKLPVEIPVS